MTAPEARMAALLLSNRLVEVGAEPLRAAEYWPVVEAVTSALGGLEALMGLDVATTAAALGDPVLATRIVALLDASVSLAFACERLEDAGIRVLSSVDEAFPARLRERLGHRCPPFLLAAGRQAAAGGIGVAGLRDPGADAAAVAGRAGERVVSLGEVLVTGLSPGVDRVAMDAALHLGGVATVVPADGLALLGRRADDRALVLGGQVGVLSPFGPEQPRTTVTARGRNRVVYGLADLTLVVASEGDVDTTFHGACEALEHGDGPVVAWVGPGCGATNPELVARGARPLADLAVLR